MSRTTARRVEALEAAAPPMMLVTCRTVTDAAAALDRGEPLPAGWGRLFTEDQVRRMAAVCSRRQAG